jgi:hypothetical protein
MPLPVTAFGFRQLTSQQVSDYNVIKSANPNANFPVIREDANGVWWTFLDQIHPQAVYQYWNLYEPWATPIWQDIIVNGGGTFTEPTWPTFGI